MVRFQGPKANGMPELHRLTPPLAVLQDKGFRVALVTDGRMSGASGKVPAAIHVTPEAADGGAIARIRDGDMIRIDADNGTLEVLVDARNLQRAFAATADLSRNEEGTGRELFKAFRNLAGRADQGASIFEVADDDEGITRRAWREAILALAPVVPVMVIESVADAVPLARALVKGGLPVLEITLRTRSAALDCIRAIMAEVEGAIVGVGHGADARAAARQRQAGLHLRRLARLAPAAPGCAREDHDIAAAARRCDGVRMHGAARVGLRASRNSSPPNRQAARPICPRSPRPCRKSASAPRAASRRRSAPRYLKLPTSSPLADHGWCRRS